MPSQDPPTTASESPDPRFSAEEEAVSHFLVAILPRPCLHAPKSSELQDPDSPSSRSISTPLTTALTDPPRRIRRPEKHSEHPLLQIAILRSSLHVRLRHRITAHLSRLRNRRTQIQHQRLPPQARRMERSHRLRLGLTRRSRSRIPAAKTHGPQGATRKGKRSEATRDR